LLDEKGSAAVTGYLSSAAKAKSAYFGKSEKKIDVNPDFNASNQTSVNERLTGIAATHASSIVMLNHNQLEDLTLASALAEFAIMHMQSLFVLEQLLLLVHHVASNSHFAKLSLLESGMGESLRRVKILRNEARDIYFYSLCELCEDSMKLEEGL